MRIPVSAVAVLLIATLAAPTRATITSGNVTGAAANISGTATAAQFVGGGAGLTGVTDAGAATRLNSVAVATTTLQTEMYAVGASTTAIAAATTTLASTMFADFAAVGVSTTAIAASTTTLAASIVAEAAARAAADVTIGASTQTLSVAVAASTTSLAAAKLSLTGGTMTGALNLTNVAVTATGQNGNIVSAASVTASSFFGDASHLTNVTATGLGELLTTVLTQTSSYTNTSNGGMLTTNLSVAPSSYSYLSYTAAGVSSFTVPVGITRIFVKAWGGGGGATDVSGFWTGGGGGFASGWITTSPGEVLTISVGGAGGDQTFGNSGGAGGVGESSLGLGAGGTGGTGNGVGYNGGGGGGGASGVARVAVSTTVLIGANGGGGAAGKYTFEAWLASMNGQTVPSSLSTTSSGTTGGNAILSSNAGGGGGGGGATLGGIGGLATVGGVGNNTGGGAGNASATTVVYGSGTTAGNNTDPNYAANYGAGSTGSGATAGAVLVFYNNPTNTAVMVSTFQAANILTVLNNGNIGVGKSFPTYNLDVAGGLSVSGTSSFSGNTTHDGSGSDIFNSTIQVKALANFPTFLSSATPSGATSSTFSVSGATLNMTVECKYSFTQLSTTGELRMIANADSTASAYSYSVNYGDNNATANAADSTANYCRLDIGTTAAGKNHSGNFTYTMNAAGATTLINSTGGFQQAALTFNTRGTCAWVNGNTPTTFTIYTTGGTITGRIRCEYEQW